MMIRGNRGSWLLATAALGLACAGPAYAQATRTWVSGVGDDANPCSRTAPCKTFPGALAKTAAGGEIDCIDSGGFGTVTITKSITIDCGGTFGAIINSATNAININDGGAAQIDVVIRNLSLNGPGTTLGLSGINFISGHSVMLENVAITNNKGPSTDIGVKFAPTATVASASFLFMHNVTINGNGISTTGGGILIQPGAGVTAKAQLRDVRVINNAGYGMRVDGTTSAAGISVTGDRVQLSGNGTAGLNASASGTNPISVMLANSTVSNNNTTGVIALGSGVVVRLSNVTVTGNAMGVNAAGGSAINSYGDNRLDGNPTVGAANNGAFTGSALPKH